jgi:hypothetical protein
MATLIGQSCSALIVQALLVDLFFIVEMSEYCGCCGKFMWPSGDPPEYWKVS